MPLIPGSRSSSEASAQRLLIRLAERTALQEGVGILQVWNVCEQRQARAQLLAEHGRRGQDAEANRMIEAVDSVADGRADPSAPWE